MLALAIIGLIVVEVILLFAAIVASFITGGLWNKECTNHSRWWSVISLGSAVEMFIPIQKLFFLVGCSPVITPIIIPIYGIICVAFIVWGATTE
jgi:hypothetical protein